MQRKEPLHQISARHAGRWFPRPVSSGARDPHHGLGGLQRPARLGENELARDGQAPRFLEQGDAELFLELRDLSAERGLRDEQIL
jgi:hypothetical protein